MDAGDRQNNLIEGNSSAHPPTGEVQAPKRDQVYWFDDGNLIVVAGDVEFRIYQRPLVDQSVVFQNMFTQAAPAADDQVDGCPAINLDDSPNDLRELFGLFYSFNVTKVDITFVSAIIRLGNKYQLKGLCDQAIGYLTTYYTTSFDAWVDGRNAAQWQPDPVHAITAINLARLTDTEAILPLAFYICATLGPDLVRGSLLEDGSTEQLTPEDMRLVLEMKVRLAAENAHTAFLLFQPRAPHSVASERALDGWVANADSLPVISPTPMAGFPVIYILGRGYFADRRLCKACWNHFEARDRELRRQVWGKLPEFLGLTIEGWDATE
ncbi:hypothetical protein LXA43DRAFT_889101 [Ganoderma leucocontextum]|nr:hypothetical protein LXA43DRAFT_889101 [Ganoderma leucocontextum]